MRQMAIGGAFAAALLQGCSLGPSVSISAVDYNRALASSSNQIILLNILRARDRLPRHHTFIGSVTGNLTLENTGSLGTSFGRNPTDPFTLSLGATVKTNPSFSVSAQDHAKFWSKLTAPVNMAVIDRLWHEGWRKEMLLLLFIESIEQVPPYEKGKKVPPATIWPNSAVNRDIRARFLQKLRELKLRIARTPSETDVAVTSKKNGVEKKWNEKRITFEYNFCQTQLPEEERSSSIFECGEREKLVRTQLSKEPPKQIQQPRKLRGGAARRSGGSRDEKKPDIRIHIRSIEAVLYYLGEIVRGQEARGDPVTFCSDYLSPSAKDKKPRCPPEKTHMLFAVARGALGQSSPGQVSVSYRGDLYSAVTKVNGFKGSVRTNQVLSLLSELQALQRDEPATLPTPQPVRVVN